MDQRPDWVESLGFAALAFFLGLIGLGPLFTDAPFPGGSFLSVGLFFLVSGLVVGYLHPERWWISAVAAWSGLLLGISAVFGAIQHRDAPVITATVEEGELSVSPVVVPSGGIGIRQENHGSAPHFLGLAGPGELESDSIRFAFKRLSPGETITLHYSLREPGRYAVACLEVTPGGVAHRDLGEVAEFVVE